MLYYCDKCGLVRSQPENLEHICEFCKNNLIPVPNKYWLDGVVCLIDNQNTKLLREELVKTSPNYDEELFNQRYYWEIELNNRSQRNLQKIKAVQQQASNIPKCPTCQSPDVEKISLSSKVVGGALFGLFSSNVRKTMHCKNCGYKW